MKKLLKKNENIGITLIALVITIILLLIIAGVVISTISADKGLFEKTKNATEQYNNGVAKESDDFDELMSVIIDMQETEYTIDPTTPTNGEVKLILGIVEGYVTEYKTQEEGWTDYSDPIVINKNGNIDVRLRDKKDRKGKTKTININNIDTSLPNKFTLQETHPTTTSITVKGETTDVADEGSNVAGIRGYQYKIDEEEWTEETIETIHTFENLIEGATYKVSMRAVDNAGNIRPATNNDTLVVCGKPPISELIMFNKIKVGDYVNYSVGAGTGTNNGVYVVDSAHTAHQGQTYNIKTYTGKWKVLHVYPASGTVEIISEGNVLAGNATSTLTLTGPGDFINSVTIFNKVASYYVNPLLADRGRCVGSNPSNPSANANKNAADSVYLTDYNVMKNNGLLKSNADYYLASRYISEPSGTGKGQSRGMYAVTSNGALSYSELAWINDYRSNPKGIRAVIRLKPSAVL